VGRRFNIYFMYIQNHHAAPYDGTIELLCMKTAATNPKTEILSHKMNTVCDSHL
jgi:hypothetical protein